MVSAYRIVAPACNSLRQRLESYVVLYILLQEKYKQQTSCRRQNGNSMLARLWVYCIVYWENQHIFLWVWHTGIVRAPCAHSPALGFHIPGIPAIFVCRKIGAGKVQIAGGVLCCLGLTCTAFTTAAWQALLTNGVVTGISIRNFQGITPQGKAIKIESIYGRYKNRNNALLAS